MSEEGQGQGQQQEQKTHRFLAQMLLFPLGPRVSVVCEGAAIHRGRPRVPKAAWQVRYYTNTAKLLAMALSGTSHEEIAQVIWDEACAEQDREGMPVVHQKAAYCDDCILEMLEHFAGRAASFVQVTNTLLSGQPILLVSDRQTEAAGLLGGLPATITEEEILKRLDQDQTLLEIRFG